MPSMPTPALVITYHVDGTETVSFHCKHGEISGRSSKTRSLPDALAGVMKSSTCSCKPGITQQLWDSMQYAIETYERDLAGDGKSDDPNVLAGQIATLDILNDRKCDAWDPTVLMEGRGGAVNVIVGHREGCPRLDARTKSGQAGTRMRIVGGDDRR